MSLEEIAKKMCAKGKGILAADESNPTCKKKFDSITVQNRILKMFHEQLDRLYSGEIAPKDLVVVKRVTKKIEDFRVSTTTKDAIIRAKKIGHDILPGRKVRYVVAKSVEGDSKSRVILCEELGGKVNFIVDYQYYEGLAIRAIWAILGPFGWTDEEIVDGGKKLTLFDFFSTFNSKSTMDDSTC